jgi:uncharacterized protein
VLFRSGGIPYFLLYAVLAALLFGVGIPVGWIVLYRKRPLSDLGITKKNLGISIALQLLFALIVIPGGFSNLSFPGWKQIIPLIGLALTIGLFEAIFWRGWVLMRLEESFGFIPAALLGSALYAAYHVGYAMPISEMLFLFLIGLMYAVAFRLTRSIFILWPVFQPAGQLITLIKDGLNLPILATLGFVEVLIAMIVMIALANRFYKKVMKRMVGKS